MLQERRKESRVELKGPFHHMLFTVGTSWISPDAFDASSEGLGLIIPRDQSPESLQEHLRISFDDDRPTVTLVLRFSQECRNAEGKIQHYRCGFELSESDRRRGINLIHLMRGSVDMRTNAPKTA